MSSNAAQCINIVLKMTPEQRTYCFDKIKKKMKPPHLQQAMNIFNMAEKVWMMRGGM